MEEEMLQNGRRVFLGFVFNSLMTPFQGPARRFQVLGLRLSLPFTCHQVCLGKGWSRVYSPLPRAKSISPSTGLEPAVEGMPLGCHVISPPFPVPLGVPAVTGELKLPYTS